MNKTTLIIIMTAVMTSFSFKSYCQNINTNENTESLITKQNINWIRQHKTDIKHIVIDLKFDWHKKQAYGTTTITFSLYNQNNKITLDAGMLSINSVALSNGTPLIFHYDESSKNDGLEIVLDKNYSPNQDITIQINYHTNYINDSDPNNIWGSFGKGIRFFKPSTTEPNKKKQIWSVGEPEFNKYWFPCYDSPNDLRTTEFIATVKKPLSAISNGNLINIKDNNDSTRTFHFKMDTPYSNHLTSFVIGEYQTIKQQYRDIQINSFCYPDETKATQASVSRLPDMMKFYSEKTGLKYPYSNYSQIFVQDFAGWMGNITVSTITENMVDDEGTHDDFLYLWDITEGEALAQQWFGNNISINHWKDTWLNKSFARYFSGLYNEYKNGLDEFLSYQLLPDHSAYLSDWNAGLRQSIINNNYEDINSFTGSNYPYIHGASVLHMLRKHLGEENWWKAIQYYVKTYTNKSVTTEDFRKSIEVTTGEPMDWFFDQWLYKIGHPIFNVTKKYDSENKILTLYVKQTQEINTNDKYNSFFKGKIEIEIDNKIEQVWLQPIAENTYTFSSSQNPKVVNFDYQNTWIKDIEFSKTQDELLYQFQYSKDILARIDAMNQLAVIAKDQKTTKKDKQKIHSAFCNVIMSSAYWRLRSNAISQLQSILSNSNNPIALDKETSTMLLKIIKTEKSWVKSNAIRLLGMTKDLKYTDIYLNELNDKSDRVVNSAAIALGKTKSQKAFNALIKLKDKPSWKNQSLISTLNGLKELNDPRGFDIAINALSDSKSPHWTLSTPIWDHRLAAAETLVSLGQADKGYPIILYQFKKSIEENDINDIFYNALQVTTLADPRGIEIFGILKNKFKDDENAMLAVNQLENQFKESIKK